MAEEKNTEKRGRLKKIIAKTAPGLAHALGGPLAGAVVEKIASAIFGDADIDEDTISEALA